MGGKGNPNEKHLGSTPCLSRPPSFFPFRLNTLITHSICKCYQWPQSLFLSQLFPLGFARLPPLQSSAPGPSIGFQSVDPHLKSIAVIKWRSQRMSVTMRSVIYDPFALGIWWYFVSVGALQKGIQHTFVGYISIFLRFDFFPLPFWMNLKLEGVFELILANHKSVIQLSFVMLWWNASFFKETIVLSVNRVYRDWCNFWSGRTHSSLSVFSALSQCPVPQKADNMNIGVVPQHFQWRNSWVIVGEVYGDFY